MVDSNRDIANKFMTWNLKCIYNGLVMLFENILK